MAVAISNFFLNALEGYSFAISFIFKESLIFES